jgi:hypothetical protein
MYKLLIRKQPVTLTILIFVALYAILQKANPSFMYKKNGELRKFGVGYKEKTIIPAWLLAIILAILSYLIIHYYIRL